MAEGKGSSHDDFILPPPGEWGLLGSSDVEFLGRIAEPKIEDTSSPQAREEIDQLERDHKRDEFDAWKKSSALEHQSRLQDIVERKDYARKIFWLVAVWLASVLLLLLITGAKGFPVIDLCRLPTGIFSREPFELSDKVLIAIVTGTTVDVIGLFIIVTNYLFHRPGQKHEGEKKKLKKVDAHGD